MKKFFLAMAVTVVAGAASAQSSVTLFGVVDAAVSGYSNVTQDAFGRDIKTSRTVMSNSGYTSSRLGFRGTEDLGGGLGASFWLEAGINNDDGSAQPIPGVAGTTIGGGGLTFNRRSTVSLSGAFGEIRLGRDYTPSFWNDTIFDPFTLLGVGVSLIGTANGYGPGFRSGFTGNSNYVRASNSVGYFLPPNLGGFYGQLMYAFNEANKYDPGALTPNLPNTQRAGRYVGGRFGYANGPLDVALAYGESTVGDDYFAGTTTSLNTWNIGGSYDFGVVKLMGEYSDSVLKTDRTNPTVGSAFGISDPGAKGWLLGATVPVGPGLIRVAYSAIRYRNTNPTSQVFGLQNPDADKFSLGYVHNLSKRTALYATVARVDNKNGASLTLGGPAFFAATAGTGPLTPKTSTGYDAGFRIVF